MGKVILGEKLSKTIVITFKIDQKTLSMLDALADKKGCTRSDLIREAIINLINKKYPMN